MQKEHRIKKLSDFLIERQALDNKSIMCILRELTVRVELLGRDRRDDLINVISELCTCKSGNENHLPACPQSRIKD